MFLIFAAVPWTAIGVIFTAFVSLVSAVFVFIKGRNSDKALESSTMVQTAFEGQERLVDSLQEEVNRHAAIAAANSASTLKCQRECDELRTRLAEALAEISVLKRRLKDAGISV